MPEEAAPSFEREVEEALSSSREAVLRAATFEEVSGLRRSLLGPKGPLAALRKRIGSLPPELRPRAGAALSSALEELEALIREREEALRTEGAEVTDLSTLAASLGRLPAAGLGLAHAISRTEEELEDVFVAMGFEVVEGPELESDYNNFEALNIPQDHPARGMWDTFYVKGFGGQLLMRTHTSPVQIRVMTSRKPPIYVVAPGRCYRRDTPDARHLPVFHQIEGLVVDQGISFANLVACVSEFTEEYFGKGVRVRFRPSYFPFTEPSAEFEISCVICDGNGCRTCSEKGWLELGGAGMVHWRVLAACGIDHEMYSGFAFGFGIDRLAQMRYGVEDLRALAEPDLRFLGSLLP